MRPYELVVIFHPEIDPDTLATLTASHRLHDH